MMILRLGAYGLMLAAALLAGPARAREMMPTSQAELIRGLIPSVVNITVRIAAGGDTGSSAGERKPVRPARTGSPSVLVSSSTPPA